MSSGPKVPGPETPRALKVSERTAIKFPGSDTGSDTSSSGTIQWSYNLSLASKFTRLSQEIRKIQ